MTKYNPRTNPRFNKTFESEDTLFDDQEEVTDFSAFDDKSNKESDDIFNDGDDLFQEDLGFEEGIGGVPPMEKHGDLLKELTNFDRFIREKVNGWLGLRWSEEQTKFIVDSQVEPIMNKKCATWCVDFLKTYTRDNNIITNIGETAYNDMMKDVIHVLWKNLGSRQDEFDIKSNGDLLRVCVEIEHAISLVLLGAGDGKYNEFLGGKMSRKENISGNNQMGQGYGQQVPKKEGFMTKMKSLLTV